MRTRTRLITRRAVTGREEDPKPKDPDATARFTQADLDRVAAEQKARGEREARKAAEEALKEKLGDGVTLDDLVALHKAASDAEEALKTDAQKDREAAAADRAAAAKEKADAAKELHRAHITAALTAAGAPEAAHAVITVPVEVGATKDEIKAAVEKLKTDLPGLFTGTQTSPSGDPGKGPNNKKQAAGTFGEAGIAEFDRRFPKSA